MKLGSRPRTPARWGGKRTGVRLREMAARWYDPATLERYIDPVLADLQAEYEDARRRSRTWQSRWIWVRGHIAFFSVILSHGGGHAMRTLKDLIGDDRRGLIRAGAWAAVTMILGTLLLVALPFRWFVPADRPDAATLAIYLVPQALPLSIPLGLTLGVMWGLGRHGVSGRSRMGVLCAAVALSAVSFAMLGWIVPRSNQAFRVSLSGQLVAKGANELTLGELRRVLRPAGSQTMAPPDDIRHLERQYHRRWAMACAPLVLSLFALVVIGPGRRSVLLLAAAGGGSILGYYVLGETDIGWLLPAIAAWAPNAVFFAASIAGILMRSRRLPTPADA